MKNKLTKKLPGIIENFEEGISKITNLSEKVACIYGSARPAEDNPLYLETMRVTETLIHNGYNIMTGGGPGVMEAANRAASEHKVQSSGISIPIPQETPSAYLDENVSHMASHFFIRKVLQVDASDIFIIMPGGVGTMDELFEVVTLMLTKQIQTRPIVIYDYQGFYQPLKVLIDHFIKQDTLSEIVYDLLIWTNEDNFEQTIKHL